MKALGEIELQLSKLGIRNRFWGKPEVRELQEVLSQDEVITHAANGRYDGGFCLLVSTDRRLLLIDKKMWYLSMEDLRFDMIAEVDYCARLLDATLSVRTLNKVLRFTTMRRKQLRDLTTYLQERVMDLRHQSTQPGEQTVAMQPVVQYVQAPMPGPGVQAAVAQPLPTPQQYSAALQVPHAVQSVLAQPVQQLYSSLINVPRTSRLRRIGSYPTSSLTVHRRFSK